MGAISLKFTVSYAVITYENNFPPSEIDLEAECNKFIKGRTVKTLTQKNVNSKKKSQILNARFSQTEENFKKIKHGFFCQLRQLDKLETILRYSWRSRRNPWFFGVHFCLPREKKNSVFLNSCSHISISLRNPLRSDILGC